MSIYKFNHISKLLLPFIVRWSLVITVAVVTWATMLSTSRNEVEHLYEQGKQLYQQNVESTYNVNSQATTDSLITTIIEKKKNMSRTATIWNNENEQFLIENFAFITNRRLSEQLDISISSIKKKAHELGLNKGCVKRKIIPSLEKGRTKDVKNKLLSVCCRNAEYFLIIC